MLLSDGLNTQDRWYTSQSSIDARMYNPADGSGTCKNIKDAGITIYTVQVNTADLHLAAEMRERYEQVLPADVGDRDRDDVQPDRNEARQAAHREVRTPRAGGMPVNL
jgi:hypothetical protein